MYSVLLVDDEKYAVRGLAAGVEWSSYGFETVYEAFDVAQAQEVVQRHAVDVAVLDIEMPGQSGLDLAEWLAETSPQTELLFLTGHANFAYAQHAMEVGAFRYLLKPVDYDELGGIIRQLAEKIRADRERLDYQSTYRKYYALWENQKPILVDRFWQDAAAGRIPARTERLEPMLRQYDIPLAADGRVRPVLISIEKWEMEFGARDEEIMEYAVRKAAEELVLNGDPGVVVGERSGSGLILFYLPGEGETAAEIPPEEAEGELTERCSSFIASCNEYFHCRLSCYVGQPVEVVALAGAYQTLLAAERDNVTATNSVMNAAEAEGCPDGAVPPPPFQEWAPLLETEDKEALAERVERYFRRLDQGRPTSEALQAYYFGFAHLMLEGSRRKGLPAPEVLSVWEAVAGAPPVKSLPALRNWSAQLVERHWAASPSGNGGHSPVIAKVIDYVKAHPEGELGREQLAATVFLNPAYLSRLFRKETGVSLTEFIQEVKLEHAMKLLAHSNLKVGSVAEAIGYTHFSYFAKIFKKASGLSPHEYRKRHRKLP
ncbi:response regulator transcription factor [Gorillibacterium sp. sgz5001074]|uniref:response regulator transcription factor n=1 Tax=Gorillibacterium sp. sgz5001074 TaxID=3446695 RepID=UPI003F661C56